MKTNVFAYAHGPFLAANCVLREVGRWFLQRTGGCWFGSLIVWSSHDSSVGLLHVGLEEHRWRRRAWQVSQTRTGFGEAGRGSSLSEQLLQKISPQFLQWCWRHRENHNNYSLLCWAYGCKLAFKRTKCLVEFLQVVSSAMVVVNADTNYKLSSDFFFHIKWKKKEFPHVRW